MKRYQRVFILLIFVLLLCVGCTNSQENDKENQNDNPNENSSIEDKKELSLVVNGTSDYMILCAEKASTNVIYGTKRFVDKVNEYCNSTFKVRRDNVPLKEERFEILVGLTNREESIQVYESLNDLSYTIKIVNNSLVIIGKDDTSTLLALYDFEQNVLNNKERCDNNSLTFKKEDEFTVQRDHELKLNEMLNLGFSVDAELEQVLRIEKLDDLYFITQSGCSDGKYYYIDMNPRTNGLNKILKFDLNFNLVATSEVIDLGHCNGMTYNPITNEIVVAHCEDKMKLIVVEPDTLTIKRNVTLTEGTGGVGITFNKDLKLYACNCTRNEVNYYDMDFHFVKKVETPERALLTDYINQDVGSDEDYIYHIMPRVGYENLIVVYNWDGVYKTTIHLKNTIEGESFIVSNGEYYVLSYKSMDGAILYKLNYTFKYE